MDIDIIDDFEVFPAIDSAIDINPFQEYKRFKKAISDSNIDFGGECSPSLLFNDFNKFNISKNALYRRDNNSNRDITSLWMSKVSYKAKEYVLDNDIKEFIGFDKNNIKELIKKSVDIDTNIYKIQKILAEYGIVLVYEQYLKRMKTAGVVFKLDTGQVIIGISLKDDTLGRLWFTLLHELSHVILHLDKLDSQGYIYDSEEDNDDKDDIIEKEADNLANETIISQHELNILLSNRYLGNKDLEHKAKELGIHIAILAGTWQFHKNDYVKFTKSIINKYRIKNLLHNTTKE
jgi:HTH-type transcriptional regulator/antitoxin HigA